MSHCYRLPEVLASCIYISPISQTDDPFLALALPAHEDPPFPLLKWLTSALPIPATIFLAGPRPLFGGSITPIKMIKKISSCWILETMKPGIRLIQRTCSESGHLGCGCLPKLLSRGLACLGVSKNHISFHRNLMHKKKNTCNQLIKAGTNGCSEPARLAKHLELF